MSMQRLLEGRIRNTRKLLRTAALIMSVLLITSSIVTTTLIPAEAFQEGGEANGRAIAYLAHHFFGDLFGTVYDLSTIAILWFAGASAMAGLLNIVPRYLPRYGMAPQWAQATRPLAVVFTLIAFAVTVLFKADVDAQSGAYATGVLVLDDFGSHRSNSGNAKAWSKVGAFSSDCHRFRLHHYPKHSRAAGRHQDRLVFYSRHCRGLSLLPGLANYRTEG